MVRRMNVYEKLTDPVALIVFVATLFLPVIVGLLAMRRTRSQSDFFVGGRAMNRWVVALSAVSSGRSSWLVLFAWGGLGAAIGPALILGLFWRRTSTAGVIAGMVTGTVVVIVWKLLLNEPTGLYELIPGFAAATVAVVAAACWPPRPRGRPARHTDGRSVRARGASAPCPYAFQIATMWAGRRSASRFETAWLRSAARTAETTPPT